MLRYVQGRDINHESFGKLNISVICCCFSIFTVVDGYIFYLRDLSFWFRVLSRSNFQYKMPNSGDTILIFRHLCSVIVSIYVSLRSHHVTQRGNGRQQTFFSEADHAAYRDLLAGDPSRRRPHRLANRHRRPLNGVSGSEPDSKVLQ